MTRILIAEVEDRTSALDHTSTGEFDVLVLDVGTRICATCSARSASSPSAEPDAGSPAVGGICLQDLRTMSPTSQDRVVRR